MASTAVPISSHPSSIPTIETTETAKPARWGPRWSPEAVASSIEQYTKETGWVEGTVWQWSQTQTTEDDIVFHTALDVMAATLHRTKTILIHSEPFNAQHSSAIAAEIRNVERTMGLLLHQFTLIRPLETPLQAFNVGVGMEEHYNLFVKFENAAKAKLSEPGLSEAVQAFDSLDKMFIDTVTLFKGAAPGEPVERPAA
ncbi:hypothetical protein K505DRAFT_400887 [Neofusicoccum parvum]|uniref:Uncharacterized protein n=1 Tax=Neofusicoccum parvum TaxID=310453 RepID=A0ACB5SNZ1_9PEZI|nr:hypothetical protein K505DRAFT_400887 [Neofusicoccum parvum]GME66425.1 hypothetical protein K505DRAFT_400887 [Neofusicoccum parvum]